MTTEHDPPGAPPPETLPPESEAEPQAQPEPAAEPATEPGPDPAAAAAGPGRLDSHNMLPPRERRRSGFERLVVRLIATCGIVAIGVAIAAIMVSSKSQGWVVGLVVAIVSVVLAAVLWSSRQL
jgi:hypothetical protein